MTRSIVLAVGLCAALSVPGLGQAPPDFSGTWVIENVERPERPAAGRPEPGGRGGGRGRGLADGGRRRSGQGPPGDRPAATDLPTKGQRIRVAQTADRLIVTTPGQGGEQVVSYALDGAETTNMVGATAMKSRTTWQGVALVTETSQSVEGQGSNATRTTREVRSINQDGRMVVRTTVNTPRSTVTTTVTYARADLG